MFWGVIAAYDTTKNEILGSEIKRNKRMQVSSRPIVNLRNWLCAMQKICIENNISEIKNPSVRFHTNKIEKQVDAEPRSLAVDKITNSLAQKEKERLYLKVDFFLISKLRKKK